MKASQCDFGEFSLRPTNRSRDDQSRRQKATSGTLGITIYNGKANRDDLVIVAAGRIAEEELLGDVYEIGCSGDDETLRNLALNLSCFHGDPTNMLLRETEASARELVKQYAATIP